MADRMVAFNSTAAQTPDGDSNTTFNLEWSFRPITTWMKIFGVPFNLKRPPPDGNNSQDQGGDCRDNCWPLSIAITLAFYLFDIGCNTYVIIEDVSDVRKKNYTATLNWNWMINEANYCMLTVPTHTALVFATFFAWKGLVRVLHELENNRPFSDKHYKKFRRICAVGSCVMFFVISYSFFFVQLQIKQMQLNLGHCHRNCGIAEACDQCKRQSTIYQESLLQIEYDGSRFSLSRFYPLLLYRMDSFRHVAHFGGRHRSDNSIC